MRLYATGSIRLPQTKAFSLCSGTIVGNLALGRGFSTSTTSSINTTNGHIPHTIFQPRIKPGGGTFAGFGHFGMLRSRSRRLPYTIVFQSFRTFRVSSLSQISRSADSACALMHSCLAVTTWSPTYLALRCSDSVRRNSPTSGLKTGHDEGQRFEVDEAFGAKKKLEA